MAVAISGAIIISEHEGSYMTRLTYRRRCDDCGYIPPSPPIIVSLPLTGTVVHGAHHRNIFVCPFCENRQVVEIQG